MLFVPGNKLDWMLKAPKYGSDALILDLEDSVAVPEKPEARKAVRQAITELCSKSIGRFVRLNAWRTGFLIEDITAVAVPGLDGVILPKAEGPEDVAALDLVLGEIEASRGLPPGGIEICPYAETASGLYKFYDICMASQRIKRAGGVTGPGPGGDMSRSLGLRLGEGATEALIFGAYSLLQARAAGITQIEGGMTGKLDDLQLVRTIAEKSKQLGASFASVIHPSHIPVINEVYSPSQSEIDDARGIVSTFTEATARGEAAIRYKSMLIDYANARGALDVLKKAEAFGIDVGTIPSIDPSGT
ncbi:hypothetical protein AOQ72_16830 [Bradyrhizobium yuanmingense]|uniref:HpcH/HpaI aldolase/citrate lyase domain-containing protein n=2 Tax=Bradyrhizobium yuanmingense TaxID=108015 RepID=A0A0R3CRF8_9BRAD|nr:hypothetical protein AOQ72_16830 [Bradyrhizobium yuanmingense]